MGAEAISPARPVSWLESARARVRPVWLPLALGTVLLAAGLLRLWGLGEKSLWFDEAYSVFTARHSLLEIPRFLRAFDTHPPLYYLLLHVWMRVVGESEVAVRLPSVLASLGGVGLTFLLAQRLAGNRVGVLAAVLLAASPFQVTAAQEARMYPVLMLSGLGASYALWLALEGGRRGYWIAYILCQALALSTHHFAFLLFLAQGIYVLAIHRERAATRGWLIAAAAIFVMYLPLVPTLVTQVATARAWPNFRPPFGLGALTDLFGMFSFGGGLYGMGTYFRRGVLPLEQRAAILLPFGLLVLAGVAGLPRRRQRAYALTYWLFPVAAISFLSLRWNMFYERYFSFVLPPYAIIVAMGISTVAGAWPKVSRAVSVAVLIVLTAYFVPALAGIYGTRSVYDWRAAARYVSARARTDDLLMFIPAYGQVPFDYYFRGGQPRVSLNLRGAPGGPAAPQGAALVEIEGARGRESITRLAERHPRLWIVATIPLGYDARAQVGRFLSAHYREAEGRDFGQVFTFLWESRTPGDRNGR